MKKGEATGATGVKTSTSKTTGKRNASATDVKGKGKGKTKSVDPTDEEYPGFLQWGGSDDDEVPGSQTKGKSRMRTHKVC